MALVYNGTTIKAITYNGTSVTQLRYGSSIAWCKPYTLSISKGTGVSSVTVTRTSTSEPSASTRTLSSGSTIYHGDRLTVSATASSGYALNSYTTSYTVSGNVSVSITAYQTAPQLSAPSISGTFTHNSVEDNYALDANIYNPNSVLVSAHIKVYTNGEYLEYDGYQNISAYGTYRWLDYYFSAGAKIIVTFSRSGYRSSNATETFGNYSSGGGTEETTTTTTS